MFVADATLVAPSRILELHACYSVCQCLHLDVKWTKLLVPNRALQFPLSLVLPRPQVSPAMINAKTILTLAQASNLGIKTMIHHGNPIDSLQDTSTTESL
jgi:hypothetical protein